MASRDDEDNSFDFDPEAPDPADWNDKPALVPCPYCGQEISEDTEICHKCGAYLLRESAPFRVEWWHVVAVALLVAILLSWLTRVV